MTKIIPEGMEAPADSVALEVTKTIETGLIAKAKELLSEPMELGDLIDALEYFCVYGRAPEMVAGRPKVTGKNIPVEVGHTSKHYTSKQLRDVCTQVQADLAPVEEDELLEAPEEVIK